MLLSEIGEMANAQESHNSCHHIETSVRIFTLPMKRSKKSLLIVPPRRWKFFTAAIENEFNMLLDKKEKCELEGAELKEWKDFK